MTTVITILEMQSDILNDMEPSSKSLLLGNLANHGVKIITNAKVAEIGEAGVSYEDAEGNLVSIPAETVVSDFGYRAYNPLEDAARKLCSEVCVIGSAIKAGNALTAMREGYEAGVRI